MCSGFWALSNQMATIARLFFLALKDNELILPLKSNSNTDHVGHEEQNIAQVIPWTRLRQAAAQRILVTLSEIYILRTFEVIKAFTHLSHRQLVGSVYWARLSARFLVGIRNLAFTLKVAYRWPTSSIEQMLPIPPTLMNISAHYQEFALWHVIRQWTTLMYFYYRAFKHH